MACKSLMVELGKFGLRPCQVRKAINAMKSPNEPTITSKQCVDILAEERKLHKDQDKAICKAVKHVFPNTWYRYCAWHIKKHVLEHLQPFRVRYSVFQEAFKKWVRSDIVEDFESQWVVLRDKYNLETCNWMMEICTRRAAEEDEDFKTMNSMPVLSSIHPIKAGKLYKGGNASIGIEETNSKNGVSAFALWYVQDNLTKAIEQARDAPFEIKRLNRFLVKFLEDQMIRKKPSKIENAYKDARVGISQVDMMPQISV
ncbi:FAR1-related sequence 5-like protein [Tanacetum coccineum]